MRPILFTAFGLPFASAPIFAGLAILTASLYFARRRSELNLSERNCWGVYACLAAGAFIGAIGGYALLYAGGPLHHVDSLLRRGVIPGGSFMGAYLGAALASALYCRAQGLKFGPIGDTIGGAAPLGLAVMRLGCLLHGCCYGRPTTLPWAIAVPGRGGSLHPTQIYEALGSAAIFVFVDRAVRPRILSGRLRGGDALLASIVLYGALRFLVDFWRAGDPGLAAAWGLTSAQWLAAAAVTAALTNLWLDFLRFKRNTKGN